MQFDEQIKKREIRVFVSSTFVDMNEEREELVKRIFPQLRRLCEQRGVTWGEVDLRWGVTDERKVLPVCFEEIKRCKPFFIGILGERYGFVPQEIPLELIEQEPWLVKYQQRSVTELEIIYSVLNDSAKYCNAFFYFRDPAYIEHLPSQYNRIDFECDNEKIKRNLDSLKEKIRIAQTQQLCSLRENFINAKELGKWILDDFTELINQLFPESSQIDPLDREALDHEMFAQHLSRVYISRDEYYSVLDNHAASKATKPMLITGESGSGKSALLANWALRYRKMHPDDFMIMHFIGSSPYNTDWVTMLQRIMAELKCRFDIPDDIPDKLDFLCSAFTKWLHMAAVKGRVVLILDALNLLEGNEETLDLFWLPPIIPENIRIFISTLPGRPLKSLLNNDILQLDIQLLTVDERREYVKMYLSQYSKALNTERLEKIATSPQTQNPLFLKALLEELRLFGSHYRLDEWIERYLSAKDTQALYRKILNRWENDYGGDSGLVGNALTCLWASRRGLSERELLEILGVNGLPVPHAEWTPLYLAIEESLTKRNGLLNFFHNYLRNAVRDTYISNEENQQKAHLRISNYFYKQDISHRKIEELPWQLTITKEWKRLGELLATKEFFLRICEHSEYELWHYWAEIEQAEGPTIEKTYSHLVSDQSIQPEILYYLGRLFYNEGYSDKALVALRQLGALHRRIGDFIGLAKTLDFQAKINEQNGNVKLSFALFEEAGRICARENDKEGEMKALMGKARTLFMMGDLPGATILYIKNGLEAKKSNDKPMLAEAYKGLADIALVLEDENLLAILGKLELLYKESDDLFGINRLGMLRADVLANNKQFSQAEVLYREFEQACSSIGDLVGVAENLGRQGLMLLRMKDYKAAIGIYEKTTVLLKSIGYNVYLERVLLNKAIAHLWLNELENARKCLEEGTQICKKIGRTDLLIKNSKLYEWVLGALGDSRGANMQKFEREMMEEDLKKTIAMMSNQELDPNAIELFHLLMK